MSNLTNTTNLSALRTINANADFAVTKRKVYFDNVGNKAEIPNRYALVRMDTYQPISVVSDRYKLRSYQNLVEKVNESIFDYFGSDMANIKISFTDWVSPTGGKFKRDVYFWDKGIPIKDHYKEKTIPHLRVYASYDSQWAEQIIFGSVYVLCMNGMVRPDWQFKVYNRHNTNKETEYTRDMFASGLDAQQKLGNDLFKLLQRKVNDAEVQYLFKNTLARITHNLLSYGSSDHVMRELGDIWNRYSSSYGHTMFAVYQAATHWSSHPITRGQAQLVIRRREQKVINMLNSNYWKGMVA